LYFLVVAKDYATLKAYGHSIDLQLTNLHNNQCQADAAGNNSSLAPCSTPGFCNPSAMNIDTNNVDSHFQELSNKDVVKKWHKWMKNCYCCCGSKLHKNSLEKHPSPLVCNHCGCTGYFSWVCLACLQGKPAMQRAAATGSVSTPLPVVDSVYPVFYSVFPLFLPVLLSPLEAFFAFAQSKRPSQRLTMCALLSFFLMPIKHPGIPVVYWLL
jgi:hypothetical protein